MYVRMYVRMYVCMYVCMSYVESVSDLAVLNALLWHY